MRKIIKTTLIISAIVFGSGLLFSQTAGARTVDPLVVQFEATPLFNEANFMPGTSVMRWVKVTNNYSGSTQRIAAEAINKTDPDNFSGKLNLVIKEGATVIFNNTLKKFFDQGETYLSDLANGAMTQYDFIITFADAGNEFQEKRVGFDIVVGFEGTEGGLPLPNPGEGTRGGGGIGDSLPPGLTIYNETHLSISATSVIIAWSTSYNSSSQVIYAAEGEAHSLDLSDSSGTPPKYGYAHTTPETDIAPKVMSHSVTITGLVPGTTYYYRAVSHASLAISGEFSFTTTATSQIAMAQTTETGNSETGTGIVQGAATQNTEQSESVALEQKNTGTVNEEPNKVVAVNEENKPKTNLFASIVNILSLGTKKSFIAVIVGIIILLILYYLILALIKRRKKKQEAENQQNGQMKT